MENFPQVSELQAGATESMSQSKEFLSVVNYLHSESKKCPGVLGQVLSQVSSMAHIKLYKLNTQPSIVLIAIASCIAQNYGKCKCFTFTMIFKI